MQSVILFNNSIKTKTKRKTMAFKKIETFVKEEEQMNNRSLKSMTQINFAEKNFKGNYDCLI